MPASVLRTRRREIHVSRIATTTTTTILLIVSRCHSSSCSTHPGRVWANIEPTVVIGRERSRDPTAYGCSDVRAGDARPPEAAPAPAAHLATAPGDRRHHHPGRALRRGRLGRVV